EPLLEINTDKAIVEIPAAASGMLREILKAAGDSVRPGDALGRMEVGGAERPVTPQQEAPAPQPLVSGAAAASLGQELSPAVRRLVKEHGLDPSQIKGTGRGGRITYEDVQNHLKRPAAPAPQSATSRLIPHSPTRRRIAQHMV